MQNADATFGVYVHWPFCLSKCPYCDFNSHVRHAAIDEPRFLRAFQTEIASTAARVPGRTVSSIFLGGGTPSLMQPETVGTILDTIGKHWTVPSGVEVTLEANPTSVEATRFRGYRAAGVNRVSLGVQALDDASLKELGRLHTAQEALDAVAIARKSFDRYSFDLIYARPRQTPQAMGGRTQARHRRSGRASVALSVDHRAGDAVPRAAQDRQARHSRRRHRPRALRPDAGDLRQRRPAGLRGVQPRAARRRVPAQSGLLARARIRRRRPRRAWPARHRRPPPRHHDREAARGLADAGRVARPRPDHRRSAHLRGARRRIPADGASPRRGHRPGALPGAGRPPARSGAHRDARRRTASSRAAATASCASRRPASRCSTRWWPIWRPDALAADGQNRYASVDQGSDPCSHDRSG